MRQAYGGIRRAAVAAALAMGGMGMAAVAARPRMDDDAPAEPDAKPKDLDALQEALVDPAPVDGKTEASFQEAMDVIDNAAKAEKAAGPLNALEKGVSAAAGAKLAAVRGRPSALSPRRLSNADKDRMARAEEKRQRRRARRGGSSS